MQLPSSIGKYEILEFLGGGMSHVYLGHDTVIDRPVVVKILTQEGSADAESKARFLQEARIAGNIQHENIVSVFDFGEFEGRPYIVMEYLRGEDLRHAIQNNRAGPLHDRLEIALQMAEALDFIHRRGIVHRDIKPENIHVDPNGRVKLMDFGIAKSAAVALTRTGMTMGTPFYMSPEQISAGKISAQTDVYAFGMLLFELLTGVRGVNGDRMESVFYQILSVPLDVTAMENAGVPPAIRELVAQCTAKQAEDRPQGFGPVIERIRAVLAEADDSAASRTGAIPETRVAAVAPPVREPARAAPSIIRLSIVVYGCVIVVTLLAVWAWYAFQPPPEIPGMIYIPAGTFLAGSDKHPVKLKAFYMDATEVTNAELADFCRDTGCEVPTAASNLPAVHVTIDQARAYAKWAKKRLPTALEWERAARGTKGALFPWGDADDPSRANVLNNSTLTEHKLMPVRSFGTYPEYQMVGNAWEMVEGEVKPSAAAVANFAALLNPAPSADEPWIAIRGGSYNQPLTPGIVYDSSSIPARYSASDIGFRCVRDP